MLRQRPTEPPSSNQLIALFDGPQFEGEAAKRADMAERELAAFEHG
jgi:hypothetical protein